MVITATVKDLVVTGPVASPLLIVRCLARAKARGVLEIPVCALDANSLSSYTQQAVRDRVAVVIVANTGVKKICTAFSALADVARAD